jgi:phosphate uptake regulator
MQITKDSKQNRRLQLVGGSTFVVSLPKNWIDELQLVPSKFVTLVKNPNNSITLFQESDEQNEPSLKATAFIGKQDPEESTRRKIIAMYLFGYNVIEIKTKGMKIPSSHSQAIRELVRSTLIGTEIIESSSEVVKMQVLTRLSQLPFNVALKRMYVTATNMHREAMHALKSSDASYAEEVAKMDDEVDRFSLYMMRNLNLALQNVQVLLESGLEKPSECLGYRVVVKCVERIADHAALIAKKVKFLANPIDKKILKEIEQLSEESLKAFENSIAALTKRDYLLAEKIATEIPQIIEKEKKQMDKLKDINENETIIKFILEDIRRTAEYSSDISEVVMDETVQSVITVN